MRDEPKQVPDQMKGLRSIIVPNLGDRKVPGRGGPG
jgi:hypothetical protein